jgi:hypothetical protein
MAVAFVAERGENVTTTNAATYTFATFTPTAGNVLVLITMATDSAANFLVSSVDGTGLTWTNSGLLAVRNDGTNFISCELRTATTTGAATGTVTVTMAETVTSMVMWIGEFSGVNTTTPLGQAIAKNEAGTTDPNVSLGSAPAATSLCVAAYMGLALDANQTAEAGWTSQLALDTLTLPTQGFGIWVSTAADQTFTATGSDILHVSFIAEIAAPAAGATSLLDSNRMSRWLVVR